MTQIANDAIPVIPRGVRLHKDTVRDLWVLLAPERTINLDPIGFAILNEIDGQRNFGEVVARLADAYSAPVDQITGDVAEFLTGLSDRRILELT
ncbi:pyrroloquinoline quinone biosynthesis peptide chaperone PqqD (plasmid) [Sulfitobacter sp. S223]|uniref:pyrroloquinoline quinone biosynthesis peptide chaperone PqqD n=1 Tax=Sulfitobacter sp. S223 TaxID=2867023 RepID=UPI0021A6E116|nr:pyrroloquinoline quinone biosynthesis peptide chaperone PqqD [Sulfitobacter sp. S223]UWR28290.1 pyrroloquinoline quinone biosynthesis peptide chaperone PqqD [Sulfitobacter sp. S223]